MSNMFDTTFTSDNASDHQPITTYGGTEFFSSHVLPTFAEVYDQMTSDSWWRILDWTKWDPITFIFIIAIQLVVILLCICICCCICCKCRNKSNKNEAEQQPASSTTDSTDEFEEILQKTSIFNKHAVGYQPVATDIDTDGENEVFVRESTGHTTPLSIDEETVVIHLDTERKMKISEDIPEEKESEEIKSSATRPSISSSTTITGFYAESNDANDAITPMGNTVNIATLSSCLKAANMTRGSSEFPPCIPCVYNPQTGQLVPMQTTSINGEDNVTVAEQQVHIYPTPVPYADRNIPYVADNIWQNNVHCVADLDHLPSLDIDAENVEDEGENKTKEQVEDEPKANWSAGQVAKWVRERGKKYEGYAQGFEDHGINGRILCQYESDGDTELVKVFEKVVSDKFHRDKLISDWKALP